MMINGSDKKTVYANVATQKCGILKTSQITVFQITSWQSHWNSITVWSISPKAIILRLLSFRRGKLWFVLLSTIHLQIILLLLLKLSPCEGPSSERKQLILVSFAVHTWVFWSGLICQTGGSSGKSGVKHLQKLLPGIIQFGLQVTNGHWDFFFLSWFTHTQTQTHTRTRTHTQIYFCNFDCDVHSKTSLYFFKWASI